MVVIIFNIAKQSLLENLDHESRKYLESFIKDFLNLSNKIIQESFGVTNVTLPRAQTYNVKSYRNLSKKPTCIIKSKKTKKKKRNNK